MTEPTEQQLKAAHGQQLAATPCQRPCSECDGWHHWLPEVAENEPDHEAAQLGLPCWWACKHCDAWITDEQLDALAEGEDLPPAVPDEQLKLEGME